MDCFNKIASSSSSSSSPLCPICRADYAVVGDIIQYDWTSHDAVREMIANRDWDLNIIVDIHALVEQEIVANEAGERLRCDWHNKFDSEDNVFFGVWLSDDSSPRRRQMK
jgi:hypothetical protein